MNETEHILIVEDEPDNDLVPFGVDNPYSYLCMQY